MRKFDLKVYSYLVLLIASCLPSARANNYNFNNHNFNNNTGDTKNSTLVRFFNGIPNVTCNFESNCTWTWSENTISNTSSSDIKAKPIGELHKYPLADADRNEEG